MVNKIYHFSHPLSQTQWDGISAAYNIPSADIEMITIKVQLDLNEPLMPQVSDIAD